MGGVEQLAEALRLVAPPPWQIAAAAAAAVGSAFAAAAAVMPVLTRFLLPRAPGTALNDHIPFARLLEGGDVIQCADGTLVAVVTLDGIATTAMRRAERTALLAGRKTWVDQLALPGLDVRVFSRRVPIAVDVGAASGIAAADEVMKRWNGRFRRAFVTEHYVVLSIAGGKARARQTIEEVITDLMTALQAYRPRRLGSGSRPGDPSALLAFWASIINPAVPPMASGRPGDIMNTLAAGDCEFDLDTGLMSFNAGGGETLHGYQLSVRTYPDHTSEALARALLTVAGRLTVFQHLHVLPDNEAELLLQHAGDLRIGTRATSTVAQQYTAAMEMVTPGSQQYSALVVHELVVQVMAPSVEEADGLAAQVRSILSDHQVRPAVDRTVAVPLWFSQLPTYDAKIRRRHMFSQNVAELLAFESAPRGLPRCDWGEGPVMVAPTVAGTAFGLCPHEHTGREAPGHMQVIARTGVGKTSLMTLLATSALRFPDLRVYVFDRDYGCLVWCMAMGGAYLSLQSSVPGVPSAHLQPFQLPPTPANEAHIVNLLRLMTATDEDVPDAAEAERCFGDVVNIWRSMHEAGRTEDCRLEVLAEAAFHRESAVYQRLRPWLPGGTYGALFAGRRNVVDLSNRITCFDMTRILDDPVAGPAVVADVFHRIQAVLAESAAPAFIIIDEAVPMLRSTVFRKQFLDILERGRKRRQVVAVMCQRPDSWEQVDPELGRALRTQCPTWILGKDPGARRADYDPFELTDTEWDVVKGLQPTPDYTILVKRPSGGPGGTAESVALDVRNNCLGRWANIFRSGKAYWREALRLRLADPEGWLDRYLDFSPAPDGVEEPTPD